MRALTNDYKDCKIIKIDPADPTSPYGVMQEGYDPNDPTYRTRMFYLQRDGQWIDEIPAARGPIPKAAMFYSKLPRKRSNCSADSGASQSCATCPSPKPT